MKRSYSTGERPLYLYLPVRGPARLKGPEGHLNVRRKSLAILYYLAFEGATRRERLADLLWDSSNPLANLRVELNAISRQLRDVGLTGIHPYQDPLQLPRSIKLDHQGAPDDMLLEGLDGLGQDFQEWLGWRRARLRTGPTLIHAHDALLDRLEGVRAPHLVVIETLPFDGARPFAEALCQRLELPLLPLNATGPGVQLAAPPYSRGLVENILSNEQSVWVLERPFFGPDPEELLELRYRMPASDLTYLTLPLISWLAARHGKFGRLDFATAARMYLTSGGHPGFLGELLKQPSDRYLTLPQKYLAALELQLRKQERPCRRLLEWFAAFGGALASHRPDLSGLEECIHELVDQRWLEPSGSGWSFTSAFSRNLLYDALPEVARLGSHRRAAAVLEQVGQSVSAQLHLLLAGETANPRLLEESLPFWAREVASGFLGLGTQLQSDNRSPFLAALEEHFLDLPRMFGPGVEQAANTLALTRHGGEQEPSGFVLAMPEGQVLLRLSGQAHVSNALGIGLSGEALPLSLRFDGRRQIVMAPGLREGTNDGQLFLPLPATFDYWFACPPARKLTIESHSERSVIELEVRFYEQNPRGVIREAWTLTA